LAAPARSSTAAWGRWWTTARTRSRNPGAEGPPMVEKIIEFCARNRLLVLLGVGFALVGSIVAIKKTRLDAIPDLSDPQVIVFTEWMGRSPTLVEDQVT